MIVVDVVYRIPDTIALFPRILFLDDARVSVGDRD